MQLSLACFSLGLCLVSVFSAPAADPELKPVLAPPPSSNPDEDPYTPLSSPWHEPKAGKVNPLTPQTGSLLSTEVASLQHDPADVVPKNSTAVVTPQEPKGLLSDIPIKDKDPNANPIQYHYPIEQDRTTAAYKESNEGIAPPPIVDLQKKDVFGVQPPNVVIDRPEDPHPMEVKTPIPDNQPCDPDRILNVTVPSASFISGINVAYLPLRFGCSSGTDVSREKVSPEVTWNNVSEDVIDFSLQMIDMGDNCNGKGIDYGLILWHVTGIKGAPSVTLKEGASHDSRLLYGGIEQPNQWLEEYYAGPCPAPSVTGCYRVKVLAHRANGRCQCGYQDVLFARPMKPEEGTLIIDHK